MNRRLVLASLGGLAVAAAGYFLSQPDSGSSGAPSSPSGPRIGIASLNSETYAAAIRAAGGTPIVLPNGDGSVEKIDAYLRDLDGLLMPGGADIPPSEWGEELHPTTKLLSNERYLFEKALITRWIKETKKPLLGICLGSQWINVAHGGSLIQDIPSELKVVHKDVDDPVTHPVTLEPGSRLRAIYGEDTFVVNSLHHQSVRRWSTMTPGRPRFLPHSSPPPQTIKRKRGLPVNEGKPILCRFAANIGSGLSVDPEAPIFVR
ncbi:MAG: gamma-glutamyl-gamma-aminobutyrate hydrolase family protein [Verrucomicrobia bacterium]|nr:gamma-glutamyl-gamma-aminobutyrate hydrolase family protein [Verrucomicrobiota bacterium]